MAFLDESGLQRFWENIVSKFVRKVDGKGLSTNDFTDAEKEKLDSLSKEVKDTDITWSNTNLVEKVSLIDFASSNLHNANRFAFANPAGIKIEHSTDGGATYFEPSVWNYPERKVKLVSSIIEGNGGYFRIGDPTGTTHRATIQDKLRITLNASSMGIYTHLKKLLLNVSTEGANGCTVTLETSIANTPDVYTARGTYSINGWTGWNSIPVDFRFGGGTNIGNIRLTFGIESLSSNESFKCYLTVYNIVALGETAWTIPSTMGKTGHLYNYDYQQNATFPANITATKFIGDGSGLTNLDATKLTGTVPVEHGGTGYTSIADTVYTTPRYRASALMNAETDPTTNGVINWIYE